jgi:carbamoyl-phosphate synthase/aspartate carbamoyltransferase/dihydroorotase
MLRLPGLIDPHTHMREPGATHKEDWDSGTRAALAGGFTLVLAMPNTNPAVVDEPTLEEALACARAKARCDYAHFLGANAENSREAPGLAGRCAGLKMYLDQTYGSLRLDELAALAEHFQRWPSESPLVVHAEGRSFTTALALARLYDRPVHFAHVSRKEEILLLRLAREKGWPVTCEVTPHHLFLDQENTAGLSPGRREVRPRLAGPDDRRVLWENLDVVDCFASDHAPHLGSEKDSPNPPPGFPGLETGLPLLLTAVHAGQLSLEDVLQRCHANPQRIFHLPEQPDTWIEVDEDAAGEVRAGELHTRAGWSPFEGWPLRGRVCRVVLRGQTAYQDGAVLAPAGSGQNVRPSM